MKTRKATSWLQIIKLSGVLIAGVVAYTGMAAINAETHASR